MTKVNSLPSSSNHTMALPGELLRLIEVGASCFIDSGYYHTKLAVFPKSPQAYAFGPFRTYDFIVFYVASKIRNPSVLIFFAALVSRS